MSYESQNEPINIYINEDELNRGVRVKARANIPKDMVYIVKASEDMKFTEQGSEYPGLFNVSHPIAIRLFLGKRETGVTKNET